MSEDINKHYTTQDGSSSLISNQFGESYHSRHGAIQESNHVFINAGLDYLIEKDYKKIKILEIGFGTGLNALLTLIKSDSLNNTLIHYHGIEAYPITLDEAKTLNYHLQLGVDQTRLINLHTSGWQEEVHLGDNFRFTKYKSTFESFTSDQVFDLIYFDAFAPTTQSHLWETPFLSSIYKLCASGATLVTYCAKGSFKRALKEVGFKLESLPGPAKKREMTRAIKA